MVIKTIEKKKIQERDLRLAESVLAELLIGSFNNLKVNSLIQRFPTWGTRTPGGT